MEEDGDEDAGGPPSKRRRVHQQLSKRRRVPQQLSRQFTDEEEDALIEFWSSTPMLYDRRHNDFKRRQRSMPVVDVDGGVRVSRLPRRRREMEKYLVQYRTC